MPKAKTQKKTGLTTRQKLAVISPRMRLGDVTAIAAKTGYDQSHVSRVLRGIRANDTIVSAAYTHVSKRKAVA